MVKAPWYSYGFLHTLFDGTVDLNGKFTVNLNISTWSLLSNCNNVVPEIF